jgi:hypothetical protein
MILLEEQNSREFQDYMTLHVAKLIKSGFVAYNTFDNNVPITNIIHMNYFSLVGESK